MCADAQPFDVERRILMETKNRTETAGSPVYFGLAGALLILIGDILQSGVATAYANAMLAERNVAATVTQASTMIGIIIGLVVYPGIFLILLLSGIRRPKRGTAFSVLWIIISALNIVSGIYGMLAGNKKLMSLSSQLVPGGHYTLALLVLAGNVCVLISCIIILRRIQKPKNSLVGSAMEK
ncbi:MAG TPA: hypothetical protein DG942_05610 [Ruminococcaceae bacterium]|jgi:hypothetical protein|nr:hypothetical protein [Oscillospiraceae bacterium]